MVVFADIAEYLLDKCQDAHDDGKKSLTLMKRDFQKHLLIDHGITDSRTVNNYWKNILLLDCHSPNGVTSSGIILEVEAVLQVCARIVNKRKRK